MAGQIEATSWRPFPRYGGKLRAATGAPPGIGTCLGGPGMPGPYGGPRRGFFEVSLYTAGTSACITSDGGV